MQQAKFPIKYGGLGFNYLKHTAHSAYIVSIIVSHSEILYHYPTTNYETDLFYETFRQSVSFLQHTNTNSPDDISIENIMNFQSNKKTKNAILFLSKIHQ